LAPRVDTFRHFTFFGGMGQVHCNHNLTIAALFSVIALCSIPAFVWYNTAMLSREDLAFMVH